MYIAQQKRKENIAEYILYLWQLEDLLRALQFSPEAIYSQLIKPRGLDPQSEQQLLLWYVELTNLLRTEGKESTGHLDHTLHIINDLNDLHLRLLKHPAATEYQRLFALLAPELPVLAGKIGGEVNDIELCFKALYGTILYRIKGVEGNNDKTVADVIELISPLIAELTDKFHKAENGQFDLFGKE